MAEIVSAVQLWICQRATDRFRQSGLPPDPQLIVWWHHLHRIVCRAASPGGDRSAVTLLTDPRDSQSWLGLPRSAARDGDAASNISDQADPVTITANKLGKRKRVIDEPLAEKKHCADAAGGHDWEAMAMRDLSEWREAFVWRHDCYYNLSKGNVPEQLVCAIADGAAPSLLGVTTARSSSLANIWFALIFGCDASPASISRCTNCLYTCDRFHTFAACLFASTFEAALETGQHSKPSACIASSRFIARKLTNVCSTGI